MRTDEQQRFSTSHSTTQPAEKAAAFYSAFGVRFGIETTPVLLQRMPTPLVAGAHVDQSSSPSAVFQLSERRSAAGQPVYCITHEEGTLAFEDNVAAAANYIEKRAEQFVAETSTEFVFVHAGAVGWQGKAILVPGCTFAGKSTLITALVEAGATYYSDEYAVVDSNGRVHAFPRMPRLRDSAGLQRAPGPVAWKGLSEGPLPPIEVGLVLKTCYRQGAEWHPRLLTAGETLLALLENTVAVRSQIELTLAALRNVVRGATGVKTLRANAAEAASKILRLADSDCKILRNEDK